MSSPALDIAAMRKLLSGRSLVGKGDHYYADVSGAVWAVGREIALALLERLEASECEVERLREVLREIVQRVAGLQPWDSLLVVAGIARLADEALQESEEEEGEGEGEDPK